MENAACWTRACAMAAIVLAPTVGTAKSFDACRATASAAYDACTAGARSDKALALAKCDNVGDAATLKTCRVQIGRAHV